MAANWQQALQALPEPGWVHSIPAWLEWWRGPLALALASLVGFISLGYRYRGKGQPFGSAAATRRALTVIGATAGLGTVLGLLLPEFPAAIGAIVPGLLMSADRGRRARGEAEIPVVESPPWFKIITFGVSLLLDRLERQVRKDRMQWCDRQMAPIHCLSQLVEAGDAVYDRLTMLVSDRHLLTRLKSDHDDFVTAVSETRRANDAGLAEESERQYHTATRALSATLGRAYDWGHSNVSLTLSRPSQRREMV